ncbi:DNA-binding GntR family transcriptional regulator [Dietzia sp. 2505]|uniref:GntR family transcriptional regulator n=1 Tax=Dietzia sp. 2505 TaxID=3156457 RepID=UPI0033983EB9
MKKSASAPLTRDGTFARRTEERVREMILDGTLPPGERLNEVSIAEVLGISRGPLREAIQRLVGEGLLTIVSHRGAFVKTFEPGEVDDLYELRTALETHSVRLVCRRATEEELRELEQLVGEAGEELSQDPARPYPADRDLHTRLTWMSGNDALAAATVEVQRQISLARQTSAKKPDRAREALAEHERLVAAIVDRDEDRAAEILRLHLDKARKSAVDALGITSE